MVAATALSPFDNICVVVFGILDGFVMLMVGSLACYHAKFRYFTYLIAISGCVCAYAFVLYDASMMLVWVFGWCGTLHVF